MKNNDWRIQGQEKYLMNSKLVFKKYKKKSLKNDHEHCEFCWDKFSEYKGDLQFGYNTLDERFWICENCYNDFHVQFGWQVIKK